MRLNTLDMLTLTLSDEQVIELIQQLKPNQQTKLLQILLKQSWSQWLELSRYGQEKIREIATEKNKDLDAMNDEERELFIDEILHES